MRERDREHNEAVSVTNEKMSLRVRCDLCLMSPFRHLLCLLHTVNAVIKSQGGFTNVFCCRIKHENIVRF